MKIAFAPVSTVEVKHVSLLNDFEHKLNNFFQSKNYGEDLKEIYIGVIIVSPKLKRFFKEQKPTYTFKPTNYIRNTISCSFNKAFNYRINLNFERFNNAGEAEAREMLKSELLSSVSLFDRFKNKIKDFNVNLFRQDLGHFLEEASA
ncbi:MAG TPA: Imm44 family immunity protein [Bacteroidia bacterium]|nr:Imm44 family immunity protein [Bacteroidia bacterium]